MLILLHKEPSERFVLLLFVARKLAQFQNLPFGPSFTPYIFLVQGCLLTFMVKTFPTQLYVAYARTSQNLGLCKASCTTCICFTFIRKFFELFPFFHKSLTQPRVNCNLLYKDLHTLLQRDYPYMLSLLFSREGCTLVPNEVKFAVKI